MNCKFTRPALAVPCAAAAFWKVVAKAETHKNCQLDIGAAPAKQIPCCGEAAFGSEFRVFAREVGRDRICRDLAGVSDPGAKDFGGEQVGARVKGVIT